MKTCADCHLVFDVPFAMFYSVNIDVKAEDRMHGENHEPDDQDIIKLEGWIPGLPLGSDGQPLANERLQRNTGFQMAFHEARSTGQPILFSLESFPGLTSVLMETPAVRGFGVPPHEAVICPIEPTTYEDVSGVLFLGVNPRRPYDSDYQSFVRTLCRTISTSLASVLLFSEQKRLAQAASERTLEAIEMEKRASML